MEQMGFFQDAKWFISKNTINIDNHSVDYSHFMKNNMKSIKNHFINSCGGLFSTPFGMTLLFSSNSIHFDLITNICL